MASRGMSSVEIAQTLFVTKNTIDTHLARCYAKLGIKSRKRLSVALDDHVDGKIISDASPDRSGGGAIDRVFWSTEL
jgi:DNA-binding NarL/FixJ family response regulator